ncbi:MAG TPA: hypothetical protein ENN61_01080, partial [Bacteroidaceae bacterium]|nr:hypothetical protein [Bacteroidaceae bacterium]
MRFNHTHTWLALIIFITFWLPLAGQNIFPSSLQFNQGKADSVVVQTRPIPYADISPRSNETFNLVTESLKQRLTEAEMYDFTVQIDTLFKQINASLNDSVLNSMQNLPARVMDNYMNTAQIYIVRLTAVQNRLSLRSRRLGSITEELNQSGKRWGLTLEQAEEEDYPDVLSDRIKMTIDTIDYARASVQQDIEFFIIQSDRISREINRLESVRSSVHEYMRLYGQNLFKKDIPGLFRSFSDLKDKTLFQERLQSFFQTIKSDVQIFHAQFRKPLVFITFVFILLLGFLIWYKKNYLRLISARKSRLSDIHLMLIHSPLLIALFITTLLIRLLYYDLPDTFNALNSIIFIIPVMILTRRFYAELTRPWLKWLMVLFLIIALYEFVFYTDIIQRIILLILSAGAFGLFLAMVLNRAAAGGFRNKSFYNLLLAIMGAFTMMLFTAIIGNIAGTYRMAELFTLAPVKIVITALAILISSKIADALIFLLLANKGVQKAHVFRDNFKVIHKKTTRYVNIFLWVIFIVTMLNLLMIKEPVFTWGERVLKEGWKLGAVDISLGRVLIFVFVIWFSIFISRIVKAILEKDVFTRVTTSRGVPGTIVMLVRIALITGGFF